MTKRKNNKKEKEMPKNYEALLKQGSYNKEASKITYGEVGTETELSFYVLPKVSEEEKMVALRSAIEFLFVRGVNEVDGYLPEFYNFGLNYALTKAYTDLVLPDNIMHISALLEHTDITQQISKKLGQKCIDDFIFVFNELVSIRKEALVRSDSFTKVINSGIKSIKDLGKMVKKIDIAKILNDVKKKLPKDLNIEDMMSFMADNIDLKNK